MVLTLKGSDDGHIVDCINEAQGYERQDQENRKS